MIHRPTRRDLLRYAGVALPAALRAQYVPFPRANASNGFTPFDIGIDFRNTSGFVTDPSYATWEVGSGTVDYPTTRSNANGQSITFGWETTYMGAYPDTRDRSTGVDARLAGIAYMVNVNGSVVVFRVDLPALGTYSIGLGISDQGSNQSTNYIQVSDDSVAIGSFNPATHAFISLLPLSLQGTGLLTGDAAGNSWSNAATWVSSNVPVSHVFSTTVLRVALGGTASAQNTVLNHLRVTRTA
jgi:hypothetical protein